MQTFETPGPGITDALVSAAKRYYKDTKPAWTAVIVHGLWNPAVHVEVEVEAFLPLSAKL